MRRKPQDYCVWKREIKCGTLIYVLTNNGGYWWNKPCGKWSCDDCLKTKIEKYKDEIYVAIPGPHVFVTELTITGPSLTQWVQRHVHGYYMKVNKPGGVILITRYHISQSKRKTKIKFSCTRKSNEKFLNGEFVEFLKQPFTGGKKVTSRQEEKKQNKKASSYGFFLPSNEANDERSSKKENIQILDEYREITDDFERGRWLDVHREQILLFSEGFRLIEEYRRQKDIKSPGQAEYQETKRRETIA